ncbi:hypothetical protein LCGC14_2200300 [marine sediment metagenome]|uniref:Uncharacterized protein n=1 Tax=marine sediment metagenome TaxID=412755 RepID=A0A0F9FU93_9ZZZZ
MKELIAAIAIIGSLLLFLFKRYWSPDAEAKKLRTEIKKLKAKRKEIRHAMRIALRNDEFNDYARLGYERELLDKDLRDLRGIE